MPREAFLARRAAAYRAYYEHMPLPARMRPDGPRMRIYTRVGWGALARLPRARRPPVPLLAGVPAPRRRGGSNTVDVEHCAALADPDRTHARARAGALARARASASRARAGTCSRSRRAWRSSTRSPGPGGAPGPTAGTAIRPRASACLNYLAERKIREPRGDRRRRALLQRLATSSSTSTIPRSPVVASEFVGTSITSQAWAQERVNRLPARQSAHPARRRPLPRLHARRRRRRSACRADLRAMESVQQREAALQHPRAFVVEDGKPGPQRA